MATWGNGRDMEPFTARDKVLPQLKPRRLILQLVPKFWPLWVPACPES